MKKRVIILLGLALFLNFNYANAQYQEQAVQRYSAYYSNGMQYLKNQQFSSAINEFRKVLRFSPYDETIQSALANAYYARAQYYQNTTKELKKALIDYKNACFYAKYWSNKTNNLGALISSCTNDINNLEKKIITKPKPSI